MSSLNIVEMEYVSGGFEIDTGSASKTSYIISTGIFKVIWDTAEHSLRGSLFGVVASAFIGLIFENIGSWGAHYVNARFDTPLNATVATPKN